MRICSAAVAVGFAHQPGELKGEAKSRWLLLIDIVVQIADQSSSSYAEGVADTE